VIGLREQDRGLRDRGNDWSEEMKMGLVERANSIGNCEIAEMREVSASRVLIERLDSLCDSGTSSEQGQCTESRGRHQR
jgi:hypothetical protein